MGLQELHDKGLAYEGFRVLPYCWECETPLSNFETAPRRLLPRPPGPGRDGALRLRAGRRRPRAAAGRDSGCSLWTTTPWTLPSNLALAVGPEISYSVLCFGQRRVVIGEACLEAYEDVLEGRRGPRHGDGRRARRASVIAPCSTSSPAPRAPLSCSAADFVAMDEGTGIVHMAPGFGEDDQRACEAAGIPSSARSTRRPLHRRGRRLRRVCRSSKPTR